MGTLAQPGLVATVTGRDFSLGLDLSLLLLPEAPTSLGTPAACSPQSVTAEIGAVGGPLLEAANPLCQTLEITQLELIWNGNPTILQLVSFINLLGCIGNFETLI